MRWNIKWVESAVSTNDLAALEQPGTVIVTDHQTAGRGQYGRTWVCPPGAAVAMSLVVPPLSSSAPFLVAWVATAVAAVAEEITTIAATVKWPNDVLLAGKKVAGILIEQTKHTVVGIGLNVNASPPELPDATSLGHGELDTKVIAERLLKELDGRFDQDHESLAADWRERLQLMDEWAVATTHAGARHEGRVVAIDFREVVMIDAHGISLRLTPEAIKNLTSVEP